MDDLLTRAAVVLVERAPDGPSSGQLRRRLAARRRRRAALVVCLVGVFVVNGLVLIVTRSPQQVVPAGPGPTGGTAPASAPSAPPAAPDTSTAPADDVAIPAERTEGPPTPASPPASPPAEVAPASTAAPSTTHPNRPPDARDDLVTAFPDATLLVSVMNNDTDPDGDRLRLVTAGAVSPSGPVVSIVRGELQVWLPPEITGTVTIPYTVGDPSGMTATGTLTVVVSAVPSTSGA